MGTRCVFTFEDQADRFHVYKHYDGYPSGAAQQLANARKLAFDLPRFEADEFSAAFIAANKKTHGDVRLLPSGSFNKVAPLDIEYHYVVAQNAKGELCVTSYEVGLDDNDKRTEHKLWSGPLDVFTASLT